MVVSLKMAHFWEQMVLWRPGGANTNETNRFYRCFEVLSGVKVCILWKSLKTLVNLVKMGVWGETIIIYVLWCFGVKSAHWRGKPLPDHRKAQVQQRFWGVPMGIGAVTVLAVFREMHIIHWK